MFTSSLLNLSLALLTASKFVTAELHCFNHEDDEPLDLKIDDITYIGNQLRADGRHDATGILYYLTPRSKRVIIEEGSVSVVIKNLNHQPASVLFEDIANTIDGGETRDEVGPALIQCLSAGGSATVYVNSSNPAYNTLEYKESGATYDGVLLKLESTGEEDL